jgi:hypothetical protein
VANYRADVSLVSCALQSQGIDSQMTPAAVMSVAVATPGVHCENLALRARVLLLSCRRRTAFLCIVSAGFGLVLPSGFVRKRKKTRYLRSLTQVSSLL